jgi:hypothetical protein
MPNIFSTINKAQGLLEHKGLAPLEKNFIQQLLDGNNTHIGLIELSHQNKPQQFKLIEKELKNYYSSIPTLNWLYKSHVKSICKDFNVLSTHFETRVNELTINSPYTIVIDTIYIQTQKKYSGTIMLPILQCMDYRLGDSKGECSGYVVEWIQSFLNDRKPFGIIPDANPPLKPISLNSKTWLRYPDLNHCVPLTKNIAELQQLNYLFATRGMDHRTKGRIYKHSAGGVVIASDPAPLARFLINVSALNPGCGIYLSLRNYRSGHALGFYKDKLSAIHFLDVNTGWYRFNSESKFMAWLPFYFKALDYEQKYHGCELFEFGFQKKPWPVLSTVWNNVSFFAKKESTLIAKRLGEPFRLFHPPVPEVGRSQEIGIPKIKIAEQSRDDSFKKRVRLGGRDAFIASLVDVKAEEFREARERSVYTF